MPELAYDHLAHLRSQQIGAAKAELRCPKCTGQIWPNYCRECDEHFTDGHWPPCEDYEKHSRHRKY